MRPSRRRRAGVGDEGHPALSLPSPGTGLPRTPQVLVGWPHRGPDPALGSAEARAVAGMGYGVQPEPEPGAGAAGKSSRLLQTGEHLQHDATDRTRRRHMGAGRPLPLSWEAAVTTRRLPRCRGCQSVRAVDSGIRPFEDGVKKSLVKER